MLYQIVQDLDCTHSVLDPSFHPCMSPFHVNTTRYSEYGLATLEVVSSALTSALYYPVVCVGEQTTFVKPFLSLDDTRGGWIRVIEHVTILHSNGR